jgi:hypothetical protein
MRDKPILSTEKMLHKDYGRKCSIKWKKWTVFVSLKGLDAKMNWLAVNHQSYSNPLSQAAP